MDLDLMSKNMKGKKGGGETILFKINLFIT